MLRSASNTSWRATAVLRKMKKPQARDVTCALICFNKSLFSSFKVSQCAGRHLLPNEPIQKTTKARFSTTAQNAVHLLNTTTSMWFPRPPAASWFKQWATFVLSAEGEFRLVPLGKTLSPAVSWGSASVKVKWWGLRIGGRAVRENMKLPENTGSNCSYIMGVWTRTWCDKKYLKPQDYLWFEADLMTHFLSESIRITAVACPSLQACTNMTSFSNLASFHISKPAFTEISPEQFTQTWINCVV